MSITIRAATSDDCSAVLKLMQGLAKFEGYINDFKVSEATLQARGFPNNKEPEFYVLLALVDDDIAAMLVYYFIPFTYDLRPTLFIKELFVNAAARGKGIGELLFSAAQSAAKDKDCGRIKWDVLHTNDAAKRFYQRQGAHRDSKWQGYILKL